MNQAWLRTVGAMYLRRQVGRNLGTIEGLSNVPAVGGFVLVPNHTSYLDHFVLDFILEAVRDRETWFLTKKESFDKPLIRAWTTAWHGIPVDRDRPTVDTLRTVQSVLDDGAALCVYPEGTRNPNPETLMEFKAGAFHFAATANVPVIPVTIVGADEVLPRGERRFRRGRIDVRFGPPILPDSTLTKPQRVKEAQREARQWMEATLEEMRAERAHESVDTSYLSARTAALANRGDLRRQKKRALMFVIQSMEHNAPRAAWAVKARTRIHGLVALNLPEPLRRAALMRATPGLRYALRVNPCDADAHYYLGTALASSRGSDPAEARMHLERATRLTSETDPRPLITLAQLEAKAGNYDRTRELLESASRVLPENDERTPHRARRIAALRDELERAA